MIKKERLKELIKQNAIIYHLISKNYQEINANDVTQYILDGWELYKEYYFETKEEVKWKLEFGNIERTKTLGLPTWEQFNYFKDTKSCYDGIGTDYFRFIGYDYYIYYLSKLDNRICLTKEDVCYYYPVKEWEITKENYIEACRVCKKLFLGE